MMLRSGRAVDYSAPAQRFADCVAALRACANRFGGEAAARKAALLRDCAGCALTEPDSLLAYHDCLLFLLAYPESATLFAAARRELRRVAAATRAMIESGPARTRARLANSGVAWAPMTIAFGYDIARWLAERHPRHAEIDSFDAGGASLPALLRHALPALEFEMLAADDAASGDLLATASEGHRGTRLQWLVAQCARLPCSEQLREQLFDALKAFITIDPGAGTLSRTFVRSPREGRTFIAATCCAAWTVWRSSPCRSHRRRHFLARSGSTCSMPAGQCSPASDAKPTRFPRRNLPASNTTRWAEG